MPFKFEQLRVWSQALDYIDLIYELASQLPRSEEYNLKSQITRAATSVALNIAEGSISQSNAEQARFLSMAIRSLVETVACQHIINRRQVLPDQEELRRAYRDAEALVASLHTMRKTLLAEGQQVRESQEDYSLDGERDL
jgi:four helix bundle protein